MSIRTFPSAMLRSGYACSSLSTALAFFRAFSPRFLPHFCALLANGVWLNLNADVLADRVGGHNVHRCVYLGLELAHLFFDRGSFLLRFLDLALKLNARTDLDCVEER